VIRHTPAIIVTLANHFSLEVGGAGGGGGGGIHSIRESMAVGPDWATADLSRQALGCFIEQHHPDALVSNATCASDRMRNQTQMSLLSRYTNGNLRL
jgi:hypothetical protein